METSHILGLSPAGFHKVAYTAWGDPAGQLTFCVHGLTRNGRDFDKLAACLAAEGRYVICPDVVGRGASDWLPRPELYNYPQYLADMTVLLAKFGDRPVDWVGTSMGGLIGLMLAAQPHNPLRRLVLNDIGPLVSKESLELLARYVGKYPAFATPDEALAYLKVIHAPFGITEDEDWQALLRHALRPLPEGGYGLSYDPAIGQAFSAAPLADVNLWPLYDSLRLPTLLLRGAQSTLLPAELAAEMTTRGPRAKLVEFPDCGHAPALFSGAQIAAVAQFLAA